MWLTRFGPVKNDGCSNSHTNVLDQRESWYAMHRFVSNQKNNFCSIAHGASKLLSPRAPKGL